MIPGDVFYPVVRVTSAGAAVTALVTADFAVTGYVATASSSPSFTATELSNGYYRLAITSVGTAGWHTYLITSSTRIIANNEWSGWLTAQDEDTLYAIVVRPTAALSSVNQLASDVPLSIVANRYTPFSVAVTDQSGAVYPLNGFNNIRFTVWDRLHANTIYTLTGVTGSVGGILAWIVPEDASFFSYMAAQIALGNDSIVFYYDVVGDAAATATKTQTIIRGQITMARYESPA